MDRSKFPQGVEVQQAQLENVETQAAFHILQRFINMSRAGRISGEITVAASTTVNAAVDVAISGDARAYAPDGEMIQLSSGVAGLLVADATASTINYIAAVYRETDTDPQAHETDGTVKYTRVVRVADVKSYTVAQYDALPASDPDLSKDARDRIVILAQVTAQGPAAFVTDVIQQSSYESILTATLTTATPNVTGVQFDDIASTVPTGTANGYLAFDTVQGMQFSSNFGVSYGPWLAAALTSGTHTLLDGAANAVVVDVEASLLSIVNGTDIYTIDDIYTDIGPIFSAEDAAHRRQKGTGVQTRANPHGLGLTDLATFFYRLPTTLILGGDLLATADGADQPRITANRATAAVGDRTLMWTSPDNGGILRGMRLYVTAAGEFELVLNAYYDNNTNLWAKDDNAVTSLRYRFYLDQFRVDRRATGAGTWSDVAWSDTPFYFTQMTTGTNTDLHVKRDIIADTGKLQAINTIPGVVATGANLTGGASTADQITATNLITTNGATGIELQNSGAIVGTGGGTSDIYQFRDGTFTGSVNSPTFQATGAGGAVNVPFNTSSFAINVAVGGITVSDLGGGYAYQGGASLVRSKTYLGSSAVFTFGQFGAVAPGDIKNLARNGFSGATAYLKPWGARSDGGASAGHNGPTQFGMAGTPTYNYLDSGDVQTGGDFEYIIPIHLPNFATLNSVVIRGAFNVDQVGPGSVIASIGRIGSSGEVVTLLDTTVHTDGWIALTGGNVYNEDGPASSTLSSQLILAGDLAAALRDIDNLYSYFMWFGNNGHPQNHILIYASLDYTVSRAT